MKSYAIYDTAAGQCIQTCTAPDIENARTVCSVGQDVAEVSVDFNQATTYFDESGEAYPIPESPGPAFVFNWTTKQWEDPRTLADFKAAKNLYINEARLKANYTSFQYSGKSIAADQLSRGDIDGVNGEVSLTNEMPANWQGAWKAIDNTYVGIPDVATWTLFYKAMVGQGSINFAHAQGLKAQLAAATTIEEVEAIVW
jgi:hypothetical protein